MTLPDVRPPASEEPPPTSVRTRGTTAYRLPDAPQAHPEGHHCPPTGRLLRGRLALGTTLETRGAGGMEGACAPRLGASPLGSRAEGSARDSRNRSSGLRVSHRSVDPEAHRGGDSQGVRSFVHLVWGLESAAGPGLLRPGP